MKKLELWNGSKDCKICGVFVTFERCCPSGETEANKIFLIIHIGTCRNSFYCIVKTFVSEYMNWLNTHLSPTASPDQCCTYEIFLKDVIDADKLEWCWLLVKNDCQCLSDKASFTYFCDNIRVQNWIAAVTKTMYFIMVGNRKGSMIYSLMTDTKVW
jgi:hypothetical protein